MPPYNRDDVFNKQPDKSNVTTALHVGEIHMETCYNWLNHVTEFVVAWGKEGDFALGDASIDEEQ